MARVITRLLVPVLIAGAACGGPSDDGAATGDSARQAPSSAAGRDTAQAREEVRRLEEELFQSFVRGDTAPSARILAADYVGVTGDGNRETKAQALANMLRDRSTGAGGTSDSIRIDSTTVRVYGDAAVAHASGTFLKRTGEQPGTVRFQNTDVYVWRDGRWQVVATHLSRVAGSEVSSRTR